MKNVFVQQLVELQKKGIHIHLTDAGYMEFLKLLKEDAEDFEMNSEAV